jgi:hypothetical protein
VNPVFFIEQPFFFQTQVPLINSVSFRLIFILLDHILDFSLRYWWKNHQPPTVQLQFALDKRLRADQSILLDFILLFLIVVLLIKLFLEGLAELNQLFGVVFITIPYKASALVGYGLVS